MATEQAIANETIAKAVVETTRLTIQAMSVATTERSQSPAGPKIGGPAMKQPNFSWEAGDKYSKLKDFRLEVNNIFASYITPHAEQLAIIKKQVRWERPAIHGILNTGRKRKNATQ